MKLRSALAVAVAVALLPSTAWSGTAPPALPDAPVATEPAAPDAAEDEQPEGEPEASTDSGQDDPAEPDPMLDSLIEEATRHFKEGHRLFMRGEYVEAATEFERSYASIRSGEALYNVVLSHSKAGEPIPAIRAARTGAPSRGFASLQRYCALMPNGSHQARHAMWSGLFCAP